MHPHRDAEGVRRLRLSHSDESGGPAGPSGKPEEGKAGTAQGYEQEGHVEDEDDVVAGGGEGADAGAEDVHGGGARGHGDAAEVAPAAAELPSLPQSVVQRLAVVRASHQRWAAAAAAVGPVIKPEPPWTAAAPAELASSRRHAVLARPSPAGPAAPGAATEPVTKAEPHHGATGPVAPPAGGDPVEREEPSPAAVGPKARTVSYFQVQAPAAAGPAAMRAAVGPALDPERLDAGDTTSGGTCARGRRRKGFPRRYPHA